MAEEPDRLRQDIENTRAALTRDVDLLAQKTSPRQVAQRRWTTLKEKVMGTSEHARHVAYDRTSQIGDKASQVTDRVGDKASQVSERVSDKASQLGDVASDKAHQAAGAVRQAPRAVTQQTQGNPLAAGLIAFGIGLLSASLIPATDAEKRAGQQLKDHSGDLTDKVKDVATDLKDDLGGTVRSAAQEVKETARDAAQTTTQTAKSNAQDVREQTRDAATS